MAPVSWSDTVLLYARTARHLLPKQWWFRMVRALQARMPVLIREPAASASSARIQSLATFLIPRLLQHRQRTADIARADQIAARHFVFLNHGEFLPEVDWQKRYVSHLWNYNLHYFDYAVDLASAHRATGDAKYVTVFEELAVDWIEGTQPGRGDGWEPYPTSLRVVNWMYAFLVFEKLLEPDARDVIVASLAKQLAFLERRLEHHILANHLLKNHKALAIGGAFFEGSTADRWADLGETGVWTELQEQVNEDGGHYERSPMYHMIVLGDFLELLLLWKALDRDVARGRTQRMTTMLRAAGVLCRPNGPIHLFQDAAHGIGPDMEQISGWGRETLECEVPEIKGVLELPNTGYYGVAFDDQNSRLLIDAGAPAPDYQPGHAHCSLLSFELDLLGLPFAVDSGVHGYADDPYREYVRSTRAHNTVVIDGKEQSEIWSAFRMARRARSVEGSGTLNGQQYVFQGSYVPYHSRNARHHRRIVGTAGNWRIEDTVEGAEGARLDSYLHIHPQWSVSVHDGFLLARTRESTVRVVPFGIDQWRLAAGERNPPRGWYCPEFGEAIHAPTVEMTVEYNDNRQFGFSLDFVVGPGGEGKGPA